MADRDVEGVGLGAGNVMPFTRRPRARAVSVGATFQRGDHVEIATRLVDRLREQAPVVFADGKLYQYAPARGLYEPVESSRQSQIVQKFAGAKIVGPDGTKLLKLKAHDVAGAMRLACDQVTDASFFTEARRGVCFANVFVEVSAEQVLEISHSPDHRARFAFNFPFVLEARPALFLGFLHQVFVRDTDAGEKIDLLQEYLGLSLLGRASSFQKALVLLGDGANGKGVLSAIAERCMPQGSVCSIPPQDAGQEYRRAELAGKLLNVVSELPEADILDSESWKAIVAGDTITGRHIREAPFTFRPVAGHLYSANRLPATTDQTHGFWRRFIVVTFNRIFELHEQNPRLADSIVEAERPAIVGWCLAGAQRALRKGALTEPASSRAALERWKQFADQVRAFVDERCIPLALDAAVCDGTAAATLYASYRQWAQDNGHRPLASNTFGERMRLLGLVSKSDGSVRRYPVRFA